MAGVLHLPDGSRVACKTDDFSMRGLGLRTESVAAVKRGDRVRVSLSADNGEHEFPLEVAAVRDNHVGLVLSQLTVDEQRNFVRCTFGSEAAWSDWDRNVLADHPLASFAEVFSFGATGYVRLLQSAYNEISARFHRPARLIKAQ